MPKKKTQKQIDNPGGRPAKIEKRVETMEDVFHEGINAIIHTDEELFILVNERLKPEERISYATFKNYKARAKQEQPHAKQVLDKLSDDEKFLYERFLSVYKSALLKQKGALFLKLGSDSKARQRWAWIIERKFDDWNIRHKLEGKHDHTVKGSMKIYRIGQDKPVNENDE